MGRRRRGLKTRVSPLESTKLCQLFGSDGKGRIHLVWKRQPQSLLSSSVNHFKVKRELQTTKKTQNILLSCSVAGDGAVVWLDFLIAPVLCHCFLMLSVRPLPLNPVLPRFKDSEDLWAGAYSTLCLQLPVTISPSW